MSKPPKLSVRVPQKLLAGVYANQMVIRHTREEFVIDFVNRFPPENVVTARVIVSPGHLKRMIGALTDNLRRFEATHGPLVHARLPRDDDAPANGPARPEAPADQPPAKVAAHPDSGGGAPPKSEAQPGGQVFAKVPEHLICGVYANQMVVSHSRDEFLLDFASVFPPDGVVTARVFVSPDQLKRMIAALKENFRRYEAAHGSIVAAHLPGLDGYVN